MTSRIHPTAILEEGVTVGSGTSVWDNVHIRHSTRIGDECIIGEKTHISYSVVIGNRVKINAFVYICTGVTLEDGVMVSAGTIFTNDRFPRATSPGVDQLRPSDPDDQMLPTIIQRGATLGAGSIIGCGLTVGTFAMVGMGSVVTKSVPPFHLVIGNPARSVGCVCRCGQPIVKFDPGELVPVEHTACPACGLEYALHQNGTLRELFTHPDLAHR